MYLISSNYRVSKERCVSHIEGTTVVYGFIFKWPNGGTTTDSSWNIDGYYAISDPFISRKLRKHPFFPE